VQADRFFLKLLKGLLAMGALLLINSLVAQDTTLVVPAGRFAPLFGLNKNQKDLPVASFKVDAYPVTNADFQKFLSTHPQWLPSEISSAFADSNYLKQGDLIADEKTQEKTWQVSKKLLKHPVVNVSWFAAQAYCESKNGRLPSILEWEYIAAADEHQANGYLNPKFVEKILNWYGKPNQTNPLGEVGNSAPNFYGVYDLLGLIWEWTLDFNSTFVNGDNRQDGDKDKNFVCGSASTGSNNREDYAAFMRYALRGSLKARYSTNNLGFRCAYDLNNTIIGK